MRSKFFTKNKITATSQLTLSSGSDQASRLFDRRDDLKWSTVGETSGTRTITWIPDNAVDVSAITIKGCNWYNFTITYNGGNNFSRELTFSGNQESNLYVDFDSVEINNTQGIVFSITETFGPSGSNVEATEIVITELLFTAGIASQYFPDPKEKSVIQELSDGTSFKVYIRQIVDYDFEDHAVNVDDRENYVDLKDRNRRESIYFVALPIIPSNIATGIILQADLPASFEASDNDGGRWNGLSGHIHLSQDFDIDNFERNLRVNGYLIKGRLIHAGGVR